MTTPLEFTTIRLGTVASTFDAARAWAETNPRDPAVVIASEQTAGRGRLGRTWHSPSGGCWMTIAWPLRHPDSGGTLALLAADILANVIESLPLAATGPAGDLEGHRAEVVQIRWPNDLLLGSDKVGGLLGELLSVAQGSVLLLGIGINVNNTIPDPTEPLRTPATSLSMHVANAPVNLDELTDRISIAMNDSFSSYDKNQLDDSTLHRLNRRLAYRGKRVRLEGAGIRHEGVLRHIDQQGRIVIEVDGEPIAFSSGELSCRPSDTDSYLS